MTMGRLARWINTDPISASPDLVDEPALLWRTDLPAPTSGPYTRWRSTSPTRQRAACLLAAVVGIPFAIVAAFVTNSTNGSGAGYLVLVVALGPIIEESVKGAAAIYLAEFRPWLVPQAGALVAVAVVAGLGFAALENLWYLEVLIADPSDQIIRLRWIAGPIVHGGGSLLVGIGAARMWQKAIATNHIADFAEVRPWIVAAAVWHGGYNAAAVILEALGAIG